LWEVPTSGRREILIVFSNFILMRTKWETTDGNWHSKVKTSAMPSLDSIKARYNQWKDMVDFTSNK
jgi:hypothetical protein